MLRCIRAFVLVCVLAQSLVGMASADGKEEITTGRSYITYYTETNGRGWPYRGVIACPYYFSKFSIIRILGLDLGTYDEFTGRRDLFSCQDHYSTLLSDRFDVWKISDGYNPTGFYNTQFLGVGK